MTQMVISVASTRTPRKTIEVARGESFLGEVLQPRQCNRSDQIRESAPLEILVHKGDGESGGLAHGRGKHGPGNPRDNSHRGRYWRYASLRSLLNK